MSQLAAKLMRENGGGSIVNVSSINGRIPMLNQSIYSITKAALISMTQAFAKELGRQSLGRPIGNGQIQAELCHFDGLR